MGFACVAGTDEAEPLGAGAEPCALAAISAATEAATGFRTLGFAGIAGAEAAGAVEAGAAED